MALQKGIHKKRDSSEYLLGPKYTALRKEFWENRKKCINENIDIDEAFEIIKSTWSYRNLDYDDFIDTLDLLEDEKRVWIDYEENIYGRLGYSRMIYYTNVGTIAPDNSYLVFNIITVIIIKIINIKHRKY